MVRHLRLLTLPLSWLYGLITYIRNKLYDWRWLKSEKFDLPVICVGNLVLGGAGKTPVTEYLVRLLAEYKIAILSRGYGRETKGFIKADGQATAASIGDEPLQYFRKFPNITVAVCEDRVKGIRQLKKDHDLVILDDAFQHRRVQPGFSILLFDFSTLLKPQFILPAGNLREYFSNYKRADVLLITKTPDGTSTALKDRCRKRFGNDMKRPVFFSKICYQSLKKVFDVRTTANEQTENNVVLQRGTKVFLLTGIANPTPLLEHLQSTGAEVRHHHYGDHYQFSRADIVKLVHDYKACKDQEKIIVTTEKDTQRLLDDSLQDLLVDLPVYYLPIEIALQAEDKATFDQKILNYVSSAKHNLTV